MVPLELNNNDFNALLALEIAKRINPNLNNRIERNSAEYAAGITETEFKEIVFDKIKKIGHINTRIPPEIQNSYQMVLKVLLENPILFRKRFISNDRNNVELINNLILHFETYPDRITGLAWAGIDILKALIHGNINKYIAREISANAINQNIFQRVIKLISLDKELDNVIDKIYDIIKIIDDINPDHRRHRNNQEEISRIKNTLIRECANALQNIAMSFASPINNEKWINRRNVILEIFTLLNSYPETRAVLNDVLSAIYNRYMRIITETDLTPEQVENIYQLLFDYFIESNNNDAKNLLIDFMGDTLQSIPDLEENLAPKKTTFIMRLLEDFYEREHEPEIYQKLLTPLTNILNLNNIIAADRLGGILKKAIIKTGYMLPAHFEQLINDHFAILGFSNISEALAKLTQNAINENDLQSINLLLRCIKTKTRSYSEGNYNNAEAAERNAFWILVRKLGEILIMEAIDDNTKIYIKEIFGMIDFDDSRLITAYHEIINRV